MSKGLGFQVNFKSAHKASHLAREIARYFHRGSALENRIETVLNTLRDHIGIKSLKKLDQGVVRAYVEHLKSKVEAGELSRKTAENYLSAFNKIVEYVNERLNKNLETVSPKSEGLSRGSFVYVDRAVSQETHQKFLSFLSQKEDIRAQALYHSVQLQREFGLRLRESLAIKTETISKALETGTLHLTKTDGTKNGREREIPILTESQREALKKALDFMKENGLFSLAPTETLKEQYRFAYEVKREFEAQTGERFTFHGERHAFAQRLISEGVDRATVSAWLGHGREEITKVYSK
ncbi:MAG: integrase domain-containing protein [Thermodesulfobacterium sp.]|nr:integrase domain-containing protein [Thermodesulfobacterium sp.]